MSIIYNNQVVAGKYTQQVVADADTVNAGIIKLATEEQVIEGVDNTTAITPFYLAQKQDKISAGDGIVIDNNEISCTVNPDEQTIVRKDNGTMQCIGQLTKSNTLKFDWEGTQAEYNVAYLNGTIQPDWYCYITDDEEFVDYGDIANQSLSNLKAEGEARFTVKANTDLDNLSSVGLGGCRIIKNKATTLNGYGITDGLNKNQITNCLLEVPQNIKLELNNGTLTLKAGSKVIVPNGFEANGTTPKFDYILIESDTTLGTAGSATGETFLLLNNDTKQLAISFHTSSQSGSSVPSAFSGVFYDTTNNTIAEYQKGVVSKQSLSLPFALYMRESGVPTSINQIFNGIGYFASTIWVDKGVKGLIPNGRNEDGTLSNIERTTSQIITRTLTNQNGDVLVGSNLNNAIGLYSVTGFVQDEVNNINTNNHIIIANITATNGVISNFQPKLPFRAVDYQEASGLGMPSNRYIDLTLGASGTNYIAPANGWYYLGRCATANGQYIDMYNTTSNYRFQTQAVGTAYCLITIPAKKGDIVKINYTVNGELNGFRFIYAQGEI